MRAWSTRPFSTLVENDRAEILLLRPLPEDDEGRTWRALVRPGGKLKPGRVVEIAQGFSVRVEDSLADAARPAHDLSPLLENRFSWSAVFKRVEAVWEELA